MRSVRRHERLLGGIGLPFLRYGPGLKFLGFLIEFRNAALIHQRDPHISILVGLQVERAPREAFFQNGDGILRDLPRFRLHLSQELFAEIRIPNHAVRIDDHVMGFDRLPRKIILRDDDARRFALGPRERL